VRLGWARELTGVSKKLMTPSVVETVIRKVGQRRITNSKDLRKLSILPDPVAREHFLSEDGDLESAMLRPGLAAKKALSTCQRVRSPRRGQR
jgi:ParB family chromosome partitioning protein